MKPSTHTQSRRIGRRNYMRAMVGGATAVGAGSVGVTLGSSDARAVLPAIGVGAAVATGAAAGYFMREVQDYVTGVDSSKTYDQLSASELHADIREDGLAMKAANDTVLTTFENLLVNSKNAALSNAKYAAVEQMNLGNTESEVTTKAHKEVDKFFVKHQKNLANHASTQVAVYGNWQSAINNITNLSISDVFVDNGGSINISDVTISLLDGTNFSTNRLENPADGVTYSPMRVVPSQYDLGTDDTLRVKPVSTGSQEVVFDSPRFASVWADVQNQHSTVKSEIGTWITNVYPSYKAGDIQLSDLVNASDIANKAPDEQGYSYAGADLALLGIDGADHKYKIDLKSDEQIVTGTIYAKGRTESLQISTVYSPGDISGTVWLAYESSDGEGGTVSDLIALEQDFEILSGIDGNGEEVSEVTFSETNQQTTNTDIQKIQEELQQLQDLQTKLEEQQRQEVTSGGGGGGILPDGQLIDGISNKILGAAAAAVAIYGAISS